jgi:hypothetical protein
MSKKMDDKDLEKISGAGELEIAKAEDLENAPSSPNQGEKEASGVGAPDDIEHQNQGSGGHTEFGSN